MSYSDIDRPVYYPAEYEYWSNFSNDYNYGKSKFAHQSPEPQMYKPKNPNILPTLNYLNERKCPIYIHHIKNDSSVFNNYNQKLISSTEPKNHVNHQKVGATNASKFVLDKLEETYWATWKPKKENAPAKKQRRKKMGDVAFREEKAEFKEHKALTEKKSSNKAHGDVSDNIIKYFKAKQFDSSSTAASVAHEEIETKKSKKKLSRKGHSQKISEKESISQEIQTEVHCPVILPQIDEDLENEDQQIALPKNSSVANLENPDSDKQLETNVKEKQTDSSDHENLTFIDHKDSIVITKEKQEKSEPKGYFQQPKCIRLYRKSGASAGYIKGGTYPLKSCLKKDNLPKGHFRLGAPGSPLFVTSSSFSSTRRK